MGERGENEKEKKDGGSSEEVVRRGRILPRMVLRVLLVEADDSTRMIIAALLRKCSYRVAAVADGLEAWEALKGRPHNVDLILTEVELPSISGYALLTLIMEHEICKRIPVIMMSSKDSISLVLKCMLRGAADFLIKPIRKNNLKNLWQHVWRRQMNDAENVPEFKDVKPEKVEADSEDDGGNNHSSDNLNFSTKNKHYQEKCSDSQSSCGTPYLEAKTTHSPNMPGKFHTKLDKASNSGDTEEYDKCAKMVETSVMPESDFGAASHHGAHMLVGVGLHEDHAFVKSMVKNMEKQPDSPGKNAFSGQSNCQTGIFTEPASGAIDLRGDFNRCPAGLDGHLHANNDGFKKVNDTPELELSLRQMHFSYTKDEQAEQHTLHHSKASAFSRYDSSKMLQPPFSISASSFALPAKDANSSHQQSFRQLPAFSNSPGHGSASQESMTVLVPGQSGQPEAAFKGAYLGFVPIPGVPFDGVHSGYGYLYPPVYHMPPGLPPLWSEKSHDEKSTHPTSSSVHSTSEVDNSEQAFYFSNESTKHYANGCVPQDGKSLEMVGATRHGSPALGLSSGLTSCLSNDVAGTLCSVNEENSVPAAAIARPTESVNDNNLLIHDGLQGKDSHCTNQREAALIKFRLKRKDRCYEKKVRYQSRKRLAEQRPRVKGQFVRQVSNETHPSDVDDGSRSFAGNN